MTKQEALKRYFGYDTFRPGQEHLMDAILSGRDALGIMPTGAGKSVCYQIPALLMDGITIVISPLISLMKDQVQSLNQAGIHAAYINSSLTENQIQKALSLAARGQYKIIYVAPERLETTNFLWFARSVKISMVAVDEAHCISQWGQDFRPSYLKIVQFVQSLSYRPVLSAFTATATEEVKNDIICVLGLRQPEVLVTGFDRKNLFFAVEQASQKDAYTVRYVKEHADESGIIYCATRKNVDKIYEKLLAQGISVTRYHAGLSNGERKENQDDFVYDRTSVIVATNAFGMGIDKSNVRYVLHYNMPQSMENYYQEAGRAGRDGEPSECILLYSAQDVVINRMLLESKEGNADFSWEENQQIRERDEKRLQIMNAYCNTTECLRTYILRYFGETQTADCGYCSNCKKEFVEKDVTEEAKLILQCVRESGQRYGINVIIGTLLGRKTAKLREYGAERFASYGKLSSHNEQELKKIAAELLSQEYLRQTQDKYALIRLTEKAAELFQGETVLTIRQPKEEESRQSDIQSSRKASGGNRRSDILNSRGLEFFDHLRELRMKIAKEESVPPYVVFSDKTLVDMCVKLPMGREEMLTVTGVGENKYEKYGEEFLDCIRAYTGGTKEKFYFGDLVEASGNTGQTKQRTKEKRVKSPFFITDEMERQIIYPESCYLGAFVEQLNELRDEESMKRLTIKEIQDWMLSEGYTEMSRVDGYLKERPTEQGEALGITVGMRKSAKGNAYEVPFFAEPVLKKIVEKYRGR